MKVHDVFHSNLLRLNLENSFEDQNSEISRFIETFIDNEWVVNDILDFKHYDKNKRLQYKVKWKDIDRNLNWYNIDQNEFKSATNVVREFHKRYFIKSNS